MATCKDCLHYEPCLEYGNILDPIHGGVICDDFKDRRRFVELPDDESENLNFIRKNLSDEARLLQLGEECAELSAAIFKLFRKTESDNPTPKTLVEIHENVIEEIEDVVLSISVISEYLRDKGIYEAKLKRWVERLKERE